MNPSRLFILTIALAIVSYAANDWLSQPPEPVSASAPADVFSGERAMNLLAHLLEEDVGHPAGSRENQVVKQRILNWLNENGIENEVQADWGCSSRRNACTYAENIIAWLPGTIPDAAYVALMAHYDSVPMAPGAGDDGAGLVAVLETARALKALGPLPNPILLVITDAEETGLAGAEAFYKFHPKAKNIGAVLNVEGSGTTGASMVLRTAMANKTLMSRFKMGAEHPYGASLANEVFKRMRNDTDFSVSTRAGIPGIDFAFSGERNHYHTPNDNVANLDPRSVQHHGENLLPTAIGLANADLDNMQSGSVVYAGTFGQWIQWPANWSIWLLALTFVLLVVAAYRFKGAYWRLLIAATALPFTILIGSSVMAYLMFMLLDALGGTRVSWPANLWPFRLVVFASMLTTGFALSNVANRYLSLPTVFLGAWCFWWVLSLLLVLFVPDAANVLLVPLIPAAVILCVTHRFVQSDSAKTTAYLVTLVLPIQLITLSMLLEQTQGYGLVVTMFFGIAMYALTMGAFVRGTVVKPVLISGLVLLIVGLVAATALPRYSAWRPQHVNINYIQNADTGSAYWRFRTAGSPPEQMQPGAELRLPAQSVYPWTTFETENLAVATNASLPAPIVTVLAESIIEDGRQVKLRLQSLREAFFLQLVLPPEANPVRYQVGGNEVTPNPSTTATEEGVNRFIFYGVQQRNVDVTIDFKGRDPVTGYILDATTQLPAQATAMLEARPPLASPVHIGDLGIVFAEVTF